ncbi:calcium-binding protein [Dongia soli]|uniref:Calcium-binding protein n=1 Tax=Dongia soli TaxID=600628 RepID=A0ABU5EGS6_9PROT|nr:calcium-binding protein [Dongia soli]MDY0884690.1 calcium-binding protein [Dongia soli]
MAQLQPTTTSFNSASTDPANRLATINPADFSTQIDNPFLIYEPGTTFVFKSPDGTFVDNFVITRETRVLEGVTCVVIHDQSIDHGELVENTFDYFAQDKAGNVWYFGEDTQEIENGKVVSTEGTWHAGVNGATPGIVMEAHPQLHDSYDQEHAAGIAEDHAQVTSLTGSAVTPYGSFHHDLLVTAETSPLEPGALDEKKYALGVGDVLELDKVTGDLIQLNQVKVDGTAGNDALRGYAGGDFLNGHDGNDHLNGLGGSDKIYGGRGNDLLDGGHDTAVDRLYGGQGNDTIHVRTHDRAFGGDGNDTLQLFDNTHFGSIAGGEEANRNLAKASGDILQFSGHLDLTHDSVSDKIGGIETLSMKNGEGGDGLKLDAHDVLDLGDGIFDPKHTGDPLPKGDAVRVEGNSGDQLTLNGGQWKEAQAANTPDDFNLFSAHTSSGHAYVLVQEDVTVHIT